MKKGFTLVELSIVLVIIGLLIGGILVGQSMIESAKLQSFVRQMQQYDSALLTFHSKYRAIPGDSRLGGLPVHGTGPIKDGILTDDDRVNNSAQNNVGYATESMLYFYELVNMLGLKVDNCPTLGSSNRSNAVGIMTVRGPSCNLPTPKYGEAKNTAIYPTAFTSATSNIDATNSKGNAYWMMECTNAGNFTCVATFTQAEAMAYDSKIDDGIHNTGDLRSGTKGSAIVLAANGQLTYGVYDVTSTVNRVIIQRFPNGL